MIIVQASHSNKLSLFNFFSKYSIVYATVEVSFFVETSHPLFGIIAFCTRFCCFIIISFRSFKINRFCFVAIILIHIQVVHLYRPTSFYHCIYNSLDIATCRINAVLLYCFCFVYMLWLQFVWVCVEGYVR